MFLKPFRIKSNSTSKGSERKRLKERLCCSYPSVPYALLDELLPSKCNLASLQISPRGIIRNVIVFTVNDEPLFFEYDDILCPTVYSLWKCPGLLPCASTRPLVVSKLQGGADLMLPGVVLTKEDNGLTAVEEGQLCSVNVIGNRASIGVGIAMMSYEAMIAAKWRGKGLKILHVYGDHLWQMGSRSDLPILPFCIPLGTQTTGDELVEECVGSFASAHIEERSSTSEKLDYCSQSYASSVNKGINDVPVSTNDASYVNTGMQVTLGSMAKEHQEELRFSENSASYCNPFDSVELDCDENVHNNPPLTDTVALSADATFPSVFSVATPSYLTTDAIPPSMDDLLHESFYLALKCSVRKHDLPMLTSTFYRSHVIPQCPQELNLDVKKSKYKKLSKLLSSMQEEGVLKVKETSKGVETITDIDFKHPNVKEVVPKHTLPASDAIRKPPVASNASVVMSGIAEMTITELYIPNRKTLPILANSGCSAASLMTQSGVREVVTKYIKDNELVSPTNPSVVVLDPPLSDSVRVKGEHPPIQLTWKDVMSKFLNEMSQGYSIQHVGAKPVYRRTKLKPITLTVVTRMGNKKATIVDNLDYFSISPTDFIHRVQRIAAASATVYNTKGGGSTQQQVMVQGNNVKLITQVLQEHHGVPLKYIEALDKTKIPKPHKRGRK